MGKRLGLVVIAALMLTGCASGEPEAAPTVTVTATPEAVAIQAAPIEVSGATPEAAPTEAVDEEARYLKGVKEAWRTELPADADLLAAATLACEQMLAGADIDSMELVTGGTPENNAWHSSQVAMLAGSTICPDALPSL